MKRARAKESTLATTASATRTIMETDASIWTNVQSTRIVDHMDSALISMERLCHVNSATAILDGLEWDVIKVGFVNIV